MYGVWQNILKTGENFFSLACVFLIRCLIVNVLVEKQVQNFPPFSSSFPRVARAIQKVSHGYILYLCSPKIPAGRASTGLRLTGI